MEILTVGRRRFNLESINTDRSFLQAEVEFFQDPEFRNPTCRAGARPAAQANWRPGICRPRRPPRSPAQFPARRRSDDQDFRQVLLSSSEAERMAPSGGASRGGSGDTRR